MKYQHKHFHTSKVRLKRALKEAQGLYEYDFHTSKVRLKPELTTAEIVAKMLFPYL